MKLVLCCIALILAVTLGIFFWKSMPAPPLAANVLADELIEIDGQQRNYRLLLPNHRPSPCPLVIAFHGVGDTPASMAGYSELESLAVEHGFILAFPAAQGIWSTLDFDQLNLDQNTDTKFIHALLGELGSKYEIDERRVYLMGMSNGATFAHLYATQYPNSVAGLVAHSGPRPARLDLVQKPTPAMFVCGELDLNFAAVEKDSKDYQSRGTLVQFIKVPSLSHAWSVAHNQQMWQFLSSTSLR